MVGAVCIGRSLPRADLTGRAQSPFDAGVVGWKTVIAAALLVAFGCAKDATEPLPTGAAATGGASGQAGTTAGSQGTSGTSGGSGANAPRGGGAAPVADASMPAPTVPADLEDAGVPAADGGIPTPPEPPRDRAPCEPVPTGMQLAFPEAEGFGRFARGGRGGSVCHVTTLADGGPGSFRECVSQGDRTVVFDVSGWITLTGNLGITANNLTIAGQTAPGGGIGIRGTKLSIGGDHIILRFLRVRRGIVTTADRNDAMAISASANHVIVDHCSIGFGTDENLSMPGDEGVGPRELTLQWSIVAWGLQRNNHSAGSLLTASNTTIHHTIYAFNSTRNPKARSEEGRPLDFVNNVIYGWNAPDPVGEAAGWDISQQAFLLADSANGRHVANAVSNYFISHGTRTAERAFTAGAADMAGQPTFQLYFEGNLLDGNGNGKLDVSSSDWSMVGTATRLGQRAPAPRVCTTDANLAYEQALQFSGASLGTRDEVDALLAQQIRAQAGVKIHDERDLAVGEDGYGTLATAAAPSDMDRDGMPDAWERQHRLDPDDAADRNADADTDGYTNLEEYLNERAAGAYPK